LEKVRLKVKGILLDLDGTIVDSTKAYLEAAKAAFAAMGRKKVDAKTVMEVPRRLEQALSISSIITGGDVRKFLDVYLNVYYQVISLKAKPMPGVSETLRKLSQKTKLALITMRYIPKEEVIKELQKFDLAEYLQIVMTALDTPRPKPSPEALIECAKRLGVQVRECAVVGDSVADARAGKTAGMITIAVLSGIFTKEELEKEKPDLILKSISEIPDFLEYAGN